MSLTVTIEGSSSCSVIPVTASSSDFNGVTTGISCAGSVVVAGTVSSMAAVAKVSGVASSLAVCASAAGGAAVVLV